jgi:hypothetical protein
METTQTPSHPIIAAILTLISVSCGAIASIMSNIDLLFRMGTGFIAMASGLMAIRYYHYATKKIRKK